MKVNPSYHSSRKKEKTEEVYLAGLAQGDRYILSDLITLAESIHPEKRKIATDVLSHCPTTEHTIRIGITGTPGVGKSTFLESYGMMLIEQGYKVAILAIDPASILQKGSILGDKTRMTELSKNTSAYIRPSSSQRMLGGVNAYTLESMRLCEAAGYDIVIVETVGVGQSETSVSNLVDLFTLLVLPGAGDEVQGIKRGIMEMADFILVNKADGERREMAEKSKRQYQDASRLMRQHKKGLTTIVDTISGLEGRGLELLWQNMKDSISSMKETGYWQENRKLQEMNWLEEKTKSWILEKHFYDNKIYHKLLDIKSDVETDDLNIFNAWKIVTS